MMADKSIRIWLKLASVLVATSGLWVGLSVGLIQVASAQVVSRQHPPFFLRGEAGQVINPLSGENADQPYSPRQTCGTSGCHNYDIITRGYHFQQGGDVLSDTFNAERPWMLSDGMFGKF